MSRHLDQAYRAENFAHILTAIDVAIDTIAKITDDGLGVSIGIAAVVVQLKQVHATISAEIDQVRQNVGAVAKVLQNNRDCK